MSYTSEKFVEAFTRNAIIKKRVSNAKDFGEFCWGNGITCVDVCAAISEFPYLVIGDIVRLIRLRKMPLEADTRESIEKIRRKGRKEFLNKGFHSRINELEEKVAVSQKLAVERKKALEEFRFLNDTSKSDEKKVLRLKRILLRAGAIEVENSVLKRRLNSQRTFETSTKLADLRKTMREMQLENNFIREKNARLVEMIRNACSGAPREKKADIRRFGTPKKKRRFHRAHNLQDIT